MFTVSLTILSFFATIVLIMWRPKGLNVAIPALCGATLTVISGSVSFTDLKVIGTDIGGAAITILSTIAMALVLDSFGVFKFIADFLARLSKNSGIRLYWLIQLMSLLVTVLFNNDGGIIIATPILLLLLKKLGIKPHQQIPYLLSAALIDTAASAPLGVSNIVNLISLKIIGMNILEYSEMMLIPAMLGIAILAALNFLVLEKELVRDLKQNRNHKKLKPKHPHLEPLDRHAHPLAPHHQPNDEMASPELKLERPSNKQARFMLMIFLYVIAVRIALFVGAYFGIPVAVTAVVGAGILLIWRWVKMRTSPLDIFKRTPWDVLFFAFGLYVVVYGVHKIGFTTWLMDQVQPAMGHSFTAISTMAFVVTIMSNLFDNHPALMIGTLTLTNMHLSPLMLHVTYLGNIIGSDIGSLIMPIGLLATLIWMHVLKQNGVHITWSRYIRLTLIVIPPTVLATILLLYGWVHLIFGV